MNLTRSDLVNIEKGKTVEFDQCEMAVLIAEGIFHTPRPPDLTAEQFVERLGPKVGQRFMDAAENVYRYFATQLNHTGIVEKVIKVEP